MAEEFGELAFEGMHHLAERMPDAVLEKIPIAGPRYFRPKDIQKRKDQHDKMQRERSGERTPRNRRSGADSYDSQSDSDYDRRRAQRGGKQSRRERERRDRDRRERGRDVVRERGYESDHAPVTPAPYSNMPYFPPPPRIAVGAPQGQAARAPYKPRPYDPNEYGERPGSRDGYYSGHPQEQAPYSPPPPLDNPWQPPTGQPGVDPARQSSAAERYQPANYGSRNRGASQPGPGSPNPNYASAVAIRPQGDYNQPYPEYPSPGYNTYLPPYDRSPSPQSHRSKSRDRSSKRHSRSRSRVGDARDKVKEGFDKHKKEVGVSALGALAGSILGNEFGGKKNGKMGMLVGAAIGGVGGNLLERRHEAQKQRKRIEHRRKQSYHDGYESY